MVEITKHRSDFITLPVTSRRLPVYHTPAPICVRRRSRRRNLLRQHVLSVTVVLLAVLMLLASHLAGTYTAQETQPVYKYYKEIRVGRGESLWSIAEKYCGDEYGDLRDYIREVCDLNGISGGQVYYGQYLTIPYYSDVHR